MTYHSSYKGFQIYEKSIRGQTSSVFFVVYLTYNRVINSVCMDYLKERVDDFCMEGDI